MPDLCIWNRCNNNCIMCTNPAGFQDKSRSFLYSKEEVIFRLKNKSEKSLKTKENINFTGGEPTIHPEFLFLMKETRSLFPDNRIVMATNGRMFSYYSFTKECLSLNNLAFEIAVHGPNSSLHDGITRTKGSFDQTVRGIKNILKYRNFTQKLEIRIVITKLNYKKIEDTVRFIKKEFPGINAIILIFMEMEGLVGKNFKIVGLSYKNFINSFSFEKFEEWTKDFSEMRLYHFPLCTLPPKVWPFAWRTLREDEVTFLPRCLKCRFKKYCLGIHKEYIELIGGEEFQPIIKNIKIKKREYFHNPIIKVET